MSDTLTLPMLIEQGEADRIRDLIASLPKAVHTFEPIPREHGEELWLPLHHAAYHGQYTIAELLLDHGAQPDARTRFRTPFHARSTALHLAARGGYTDVVELLLDRGAEVDLIDALSRTPLSRAARYGRPKIVKLLADAGANLEHQEIEFRTPLHLAILGDHAATASGDAYDAAQALLEAGADVNAICPKDHGNYTPLHRCIRLAEKGDERKTDLARLLLAFGADPDSVDPTFKQSPRTLVTATSLVNLFE